MFHPFWNTNATYNFANNLLVAMAMSHKGLEKED